MAALRVVTWNIRAAIGVGPFPDRWWERISADRLREIGTFIGSLGADVVALQEVALVSRNGELVDNAGDLARQLGWNVRFGAVRAFDVLDGGARVGVGCFGNALLSPFPIIDARTLSLPQAQADALVEPAGSDRRGAGLTYAEAPPSIREVRCLLLGTVAGLRVGTAHLSHVGSGERLLQAAAMAHAGADVLLGDLNAPIDAAELAPLAAWTDAFVEPPRSDARISTDDGWRIDHVLVRSASVSVPARVLREAGELSDHFPVVAEIAER